VKEKTVKGTPQNVTEISVTFVLQSFPEKKAEMFAEKDCARFGFIIHSYFNKERQK